MLSIRLLGELQVFDGADALPLPPSRKTRLLVAYLAAASRPQRRERLCELIWDQPDDPKGALRWSLSRLRALLGGEAVQADRQTVALAVSSEAVDLCEARRLLAEGVGAASTETLRRAAALFRGPVLEGLEAPTPELQSWLAGLREEMRRLQASVLIALDDREPPGSEDAVDPLRTLVQLDPYAEDAWARLVRRLVALGRMQEAEAQAAAARAALADVGGATHALDDALRPAPARAPPPPQEIRFCRAADGTRIAYALSGKGPPLVKAANWLNHLEFDWESPIWDHVLHRLSRDWRLLRYDARGNGLSDWDCGDLSLDHWVSDLEAVVDAAGYDRFPLLGVSQGCAISVAYAVRHPERVSHLILYAGFAAGVFARETSNEEERERRVAQGVLIKTGWGQANPAFRQLFTSLFIPEATREQADAFNELQRRTASPECAHRYWNAVTWLDVRPLLSRVRAPTLVMHPLGDANIACELGGQLAAGIPGARFVELPGNNHLILEGEPATERFFEEVERFLQA